MKYEQQLSRNILTAVQKVKDKFDLLCTEDIYTRHFDGDVKDKLINDKTGYFSELVHCSMEQEVEELIRAILLKKDWFESNPNEYLFPLAGYNQQSEEAINANKQRIAELKKFYSFVGDECDTAAGINFNERI